MATDEEADAEEKITIIYPLDPEFNLDGYLVDNLVSKISWQNVYTRIVEDDSGFYYINDYTTSLTPHYQLGLENEHWSWGLDYRQQWYPYLMRNIRTENDKFGISIFRDNLIFNWNRNGKIIIYS